MGEYGVHGGNLQNFRTQPVIESYWAKYEESSRKKDPSGLGFSETKDKELSWFQYADGTTDSYVKRGFDEDYVQKMERFEGLSTEYRIFTTDTTIRFKPKDYIHIGDRKLRIKKVLPLMNYNDNVKMYNYSGDTYRRMAPKLIYLE